MNANKYGFAVASASLMMVVSAPASAQYYPYPSQRGGVAGEIERGAAAAANVAGTIAQALRGTRESLSVGACQVKAARYGRATVVDVRPKGRRSLVVRGYIEPSARYGSWGTRHAQAYQQRTFTCTVRDNGEVRKFKTKRVRR